MNECYFPLYLAKFLVSELEEKGTNLNNNLYNACREIVRLNEVVDRLNKVIEKTNIAFEQVQLHSGVYACKNCGTPMYLSIDKLKWQCPECE